MNEYLWMIKKWVPKWPMKVVSIKEAMGSATTASAAGNAIPSISLESASSLKISLHITRFQC